MFKITLLQRVGSWPTIVVFCFVLQLMYLKLIYMKSIYLPIIVVMVDERVRCYDSQHIPQPIRGATILSGV